MTAARSGFPTREHEVDFCVVGGGMAGVCAAIAAARRGTRVVLMQDRPVLGGNASSECRVHICGADVHGNHPGLRETGILEELRLENLHRNPHQNYSVWDTVVYEKVRFEPNIELLLNCSCLDATTDGSRIVSVTGWQLTTQTCHTVRARIFADCSGDGVLAPLSGAEWRMGREGRDEYGESIAPEKADSRTMGMTCLFQGRKYDSEQPFEPPRWAHRYDRCEDIPYGKGGHSRLEMGYWWIELGGEQHSICDTEDIRDELLRTTYGVWDHIKNRCADRAAAANWALEWIQFLPAKRESRRYIGDHVLTQGDIESEGRFDDLVAYGGWSMDDHHPAGFRAAQIGAPATIFHHAPAPYGIPYRSLYSRNVDNLMFAGRVASCTHAAMSSTRVMGTGCSMGQAVGTAASLAVRKGIDPRGVNDHVDELQQALLEDDCYLPWTPQRFPELTTAATLESSQGNPEPVRDGTNRPVGEDLHAWCCRPGDWIEYSFKTVRRVEKVTLLLDTDFDSIIAMSVHRDDQCRTIPDVVPRRLRIEAVADGKRRPIAEIDGNYRRLVTVPVGEDVTSVRVTIEETWGSDSTRVYGYYLA